MRRSAKWPRILASRYEALADGLVSKVDHVAAHAVELGQEPHRVAVAMHPGAAQPAAGGLVDEAVRPGA